MALPPPTEGLTRLHVTQTYTATSSITINATRRTEKQGFKLIQASSMFINEGAPCDGGYSDCHDSNAVRYIGSDLARHQTAFNGLSQPSFLFNNPSALGSTWLDILHTDDQSWQGSTGAGTSGNSPNARIALDELPASQTVTPQGYITATTNPNDDNVNAWLHDDDPAAASWTNGESDQISYWLLAQDNPPEPWADHGLRPGLTFLNFEGGYNCFPVKDAAQPTTAAVTSINGYTDKALELDYNLGSANGNWAQVRCDFSPPLNLSAYDHLRFDWRGAPSAANSLEIGLIDPAGHIFGRGYHHPTQRAWWGPMVVPFSFLQPWTNGTQFNPAQVSALFVSVVKDPADDVGGSGSIAIDNLSAFNVGSRTVPATFETVPSNRVAAQAAANWLASQQKPTGMVKSWEEEGSCVAHTYDQALALMVFANEDMWTQADALVNGLANAQNADGSWTKSRNCDTLAAVDGNKWEGDIAWAIYALSRYQKLGGTQPQAATALQKAADWLATRVNPADGCLVIDHTEGTLDAWWAFRLAGPSYMDEEQKIRNCLLTYYWDNSMGRFKGGRDWWQPYLDNQTWGGVFLKAIGEHAKARRALSYARDVLRVPAQGGPLFGVDGQAGPWSIWNEGAAQYIVAGGEGAQALLRELLAQQEENGAMIGSPDEFNGGGVWTTRWHGVAPTAWLYNALSSEPFHPGADTAGVFRPSNGLLYLKNTHETGFADYALNYGLPGDYPVVGDWDGNGTITIGIYRDGHFYLRNSNTIGFAEIVFAFGQPGDQPIAGDWNGDGVDTVGVFRNGLFFLRNSNTEGAPDMSFGLGNPGDVGIAGDWNGDGFDTTGVFRPGNGIIFLKDKNETGIADYALNYGLPGDKPVMGDWDNDGIDTIGIYRNGTFFLRNENTNGFATIVFGLGNPGDHPIAGDWDGLP